MTDAATLKLTIQAALRANGVAQMDSSNCEFASYLVESFPNDKETIREAFLDYFKQYGAPEEDFSTDWMILSRLDKILGPK